MGLILVTYDLNGPYKKYNDLHEKITEFENWCHPLESVWFISTNLSNRNVFSKLSEVLDDTDHLMVIQLSGLDQAEWSDSIDQNVTQWIVNYWGR